MLTIKLSNPRYQYAYNYRGILYSATGDQQAAIASYDIALGIDPNFINAHLNKGRALSIMDQHQEAILSYNAVIKLDPNNNDIYIIIVSV